MIAKLVTFVFFLLLYCSSAMVARQIGNVAYDVWLGTTIAILVSRSIEDRKEKP